MPKPNVESESTLVLFLFICYQIFSSWSFNLFWGNWKENWLTWKTSAMKTTRKASKNIDTWRKVIHSSMIQEKSLSTALRCLLKATDCLYKNFCVWADFDLNQHEREEQLSMAMARVERFGKRKLLCLCFQYNTFSLPGKWEERSD